MSSREGVRGDAEFHTTSRQPIYRGRVVGVDSHRFVLPDGTEACHDLVDLPDVVAIIAVRSEAANSGLNVVLVEQLRNSVEGWMHEIPAGHIDAGETPLEAARRELREETGYSASRWTSIGARLTCPGVSRQLMHFFLAEGLESGTQQLEPGEVLRVREVSLRSLVDELLTGVPEEGHRIVDTKTHLAVLHAAAVLTARTAREGDAP